MKKIGITFTLFAVIMVGSIGCGSRESTVIEAPTKADAPEMDPEEYAKAMKESMSRPKSGN